MDIIERKLWIFVSERKKEREREREREKGHARGVLNGIIVVRLR